MTPPVYVLLPVHDRKAVTLAFVADLVRQTYADCRLVLIDDGSRDGTADAVRARMPGVTVLRGDGEWWWAGSLQRGFDWLAAQRPADDAVVLIINDDVRIDPSFVATGVRLLAGDARKLVLAQHRLAGDEPSESGIHFDAARLRFTPAARPGDINCLSTRGLFLTWRAVKEIGPLRPRLLPHYLSDYEYTMRAHRKGFSLVTTPALALEPDLANTGFHGGRQGAFGAFLLEYFSKRSAPNPVYWSAFVVATVPPRWVLPGLARVWWRALRDLAGAVRRA